MFPLLLVHSYNTRSCLYTYISVLEKCLCVRLASDRCVKEEDVYFTWKLPFLFMLRKIISKWEWWSLFSASPLCFYFSCSYVACTQIPHQGLAVFSVNTSFFFCPFCLFSFSGMSSTCWLFNKGILWLFKMFSEDLFVWIPAWINIQSTIVLTSMYRMGLFVHLFSVMSGICFFLEKLFK